LYPVTQAENAKPLSLLPDSSAAYLSNIIGDESNNELDPARSTLFVKSQMISQPLR